MNSKIIMEFLKRYWPHYLCGAVFLGIGSYIQTLMPKILGNIVDHLGKKEIVANKILSYIGYMILVAILSFGARFIWRYFIIGNGRNLECYLRQRLFEHLQKMSLEFYTERKTGDLMAYAINDISAVRMTFGPGIALIINGVALSSISLFSMGRFIHPRLTLFTLFPIPIIIILMLKIGK